MRIRVFLSIFIFLFLLTPHISRAENSNPVINDLSDKINEYNQKIGELSKQKDSLSNQLKYIDFQTNLTELKINQTEDSIKIVKQEIENLSTQIKELDSKLNYLSELLIKQIVQSYKSEKRSPKITALIQNNLNKIIAQHKYLSEVQKNNQETIIKLETTRTDFDFQKQEKENKQLELQKLEKNLADQKENLVKQKTEKNTLLDITKNDETKYLKLKLEAENELNTLVAAVFTGKRQVKKGEILGMMGNSGYSFGDHLHFGLYQLKESDLSKWTYANDIDSDQYIKDHIWPMEGKRIITQTRGVTQYAYLYSDRFHHGVDIVSDNKAIRAVNDGVAYFFRNPKSSLGNHVKLFHADGKMTLYLHMQ